MKKFMFLFTILLPIILLGEEVVEIPDVVTDTLTTTVENFLPKTFTMSAIFVATVQILKKVLASFKIDVSGLKSQWLAILIAVLYVLVNLNVWNDGVISSEDIVLIIQAIISSVGGIFSYKLLWRKPNTDEVKPSENKSEIF